MGRKIGYHWPRNSSPTDRMVRCDICGAMGRLDTMWRDGDNLLRCSNHDHGRGYNELTRANADAARRNRGNTVTSEGGAFYDVLGDENLAHRTTREDIDL